MSYSYAYTTQPLSAPYNFGTGDYQQLTEYVKQQSQRAEQARQAGTNQTTYRVAPVVATYSNQQQKTSSINGALPQDLGQYTAGSVVGSATRYYPVQNGGVGLVVSPFQNAAQASIGSSNDWHTVGVLRQGNTAWVYDPAYQMNSQQRLPMIPGTSNVGRLIQTFGKNGIQQIQVYGHGSTEQDCMGRSAQWLDNVVGAPGAVAPYPPNTFQPGLLTPGWQFVSRT